MAEIPPESTHDPGLVTDTHGIVAFQGASTVRSLTATPKPVHYLHVGLHWISPEEISTKVMDSLPCGTRLFEIHPCLQNPNAPAHLEDNYNGTMMIVFENNQQQMEFLYWCRDPDFALDFPDKCEEMEAVFDRLEDNITWKFVRKPEIAKHLFLLSNIAMDISEQAIRDSVEAYKTAITRKNRVDAARHQTDAANYVKPTTDFEATTDLEDVHPDPEPQGYY